nr:DUF3017 domain-containing protein [Corynebacterium lactis]
MREIARRARREDLPDPKVNPHSKAEPPMGASWPLWLQYALYGALFFGIGAFAVFLGLERWRRATFALGMTMILLGVLRQYLPDSILGVFSVRSRLFDFIFCTILGAGMVFLSVSVDALGS